MKNALIIYIVAIVTLMFGSQTKATDGQLNDAAESPREIIYKQTIRSTRHEQICTPGSKFGDSCEMCICSKDGTKLTCKSKPCSDPSRQKRDITVPKKLIQDCYYCSCEPFDGHILCSTSLVPGCDMEAFRNGTRSQ